MFCMDFRNCLRAQHIVTSILSGNLFWSLPENVDKNFTSLYFEYLLATKKHFPFFSNYECLLPLCQKCWPTQLKAVSMTMVWQVFLPPHQSLVTWLAHLLPVKIINWLTFDLHISRVDMSIINIHNVDLIILVKISLMSISLKIIIILTIISRW